MLALAGRQQARVAGLRLLLPAAAQAAWVQQQERGLAMLDVRMAWERTAACGLAGCQSGVGGGSRPLPPAPIDRLRRSTQPCPAPLVQMFNEEERMKRKAKIKVCLPCSTAACRLLLGSSARLCFPCCCRRHDCTSASVARPRSTTTQAT